MREITSSFKARLNAGATTLCSCWRVIRRDGAIQGFTDHDVDVVFDGLAHSASSGLDGSGFDAELGFAIGGAEAAGALSAASITEDELLNGAWDGARVELWRVDWAAPENRILLHAAVVGEVRRDGHRFVAELRSLAHALNQERGRLFSGQCDADLGDGRCRFASVSTPFLHEAVVTAFEDLRLTLQLPAVADGFYTYGRLTFLDGVNAGATTTVRDHLGDTLSLWTAPGFAPELGDRVRVHAGCDKTFTTCRAKFANVSNFRGFPHLPGNDALFAPAGAGKVLDGGSMFR